METPLLRDPKVFPAAEVLEEVLQRAYPVFEELIEIITTPEFSLEPEWKYYKDGKSWLCKVRHKKKTIFWLSVWNQYFKAGFYFTSATSAGVTGLDIKKSLKENLNQSKPIGKLIPLIVDLRKREQLKDLLKIIEYKKSLK